MFNKQTIEVEAEFLHTDLYAYHPRLHLRIFKSVHSHQFIVVIDDGIKSSSRIVHLFGQNVWRLDDLLPVLDLYN